MSILLSALLLGAAPLADIDRASLDMQARAEALQLRPASQNRAGLFELEAMTTVCRAAGGQPDPTAFLNTLSRAYGLSRSDSGLLRTSCAAYLAGRADRRR